MDFFNRLAERFIRANKRLKKWQRAVSLLAAVVVFVTTYALVLPAITLDKETASTQAGIEVAASENDPDREGTVYEAEPEEEPSEETQEEDLQDAEPVMESSDAESGSQDAEASSEEDNTDEDREAADGQCEEKQAGSEEAETEEPADDAGPANDEAENAAEPTAETVTEGEKLEETRLITEETQLVYEYIDEEYENGIDDENDDGIDDGYIVYAEFGAEAKLPEGVELIAEEITKESDPEIYEAYYEKALSGLQDKYDEKTALSFARFYDIRFVYNGEEIEPSGDVKVRIEYKKAVEIEKETNVDAVHFDKNNDEEPEVIDSEVEAEKKGKDDTVKTVEFESAQFSVYGIIGSYTVDFHWEVDGKTYESSIPGGGFISLEQLVEVLDIAEDPQAFAADVEKAVFSDPELVWIGKAEEDTTVGGLKEANGLECEYSAELTEEQIEEINAQTVQAGDWALISVHPFTTEETLTVTMKNGEQFVVKVTDAQISAHVITADGKDYTITVTYGPEAGIPKGARLEAEEIPEGTEKYESMLAQSREALDEGGSTEIIFARFFDVSILDQDGNEIEPENPVSVTIQYNDPVNTADANAAIVHFAEEGIEIIHPDTRLAGEGQEDEINVFEYMQGSFSGIGTIVESDALEDGQYFIIVGDNGNYYAMKNDGSMVAVTYYSQTKQVEAAPGTDENDLLWHVSGVGYGYYTFKAVNGNNYLSLQNGAVVNNQSANILVQHNEWDETQTETGGYNLYHTPNPWDSGTWNPLRMGYWDNASHFYVGDAGSTPQRIKLYKYAMSSSSGEPPATNTYTGIEVNPSELDEWLMSLFDDMPIGYDGYHKTAEVYDYENRIYQIDFTAMSNAQGFASDIDIAFSVDMSNSMLFPSVLTEVGTIELKQSVLESTLDKEQVYFIISDIKQTATVTAVFYENGVWKHEDASKYARGQRNSSNTDIVVGDTPGYKVQGTDTGFYTLYKADPGYVEYIRNNGTVWENPYNRLADMKQSMRMAFNFLDIMKDKYNATIRVGWNGFARDVRYDNGKTGQSQEKFDYRCAVNGHALQNLENVDYNDIISGFADAGSQTGGGTRPDKAFIDAANMGWGSDTEKYLVLITDGAPQGGGAQSPADALQLGIEEGQNLTNNQGVKIISIGLSTEHVDNAGSDAGLFKNISCMDPTPGSDQQMIYQAKDGDALKSAVVDALRILVSKAITVGTVKDTIDPAFYPVSTDGTPLKAGDRIDLSGKLTTDTSKPHGVIGWDGENWTVEWTDQDIVWADDEHPYGWHGRVLVKAKENFLGGNDISTNKGDATLDVKNAKILNANGTWSDIPFISLMDLTPDQLETRTMDTPHVNVDELEMTKNDTEWTVYLNTKVDPGEQMKALFNEIKVMKVVTDGVHEMAVQDGETARDVMVYDLVPTEDGTYSYEEASSDERDKRDVEQAFFYLKDLFNMQDSLGSDFIIDNMTAEQAIAKLLDGEKVEVKYQGYGHGTADKPVGTIILELKSDPDAQVNNLDEHPAAPEGSAIEKYILTAEYKPAESELASWKWNTGTFGTKDKGKEAEDKTKTNTHIINVIKRMLTVKKTDSDGNLINNAEAGEATFEIYQKDGTGNKVNAVTVTTSGGVYTWNPIVPDIDQEIPKEYWADETTYYIKEVTSPQGYAVFDGEITVTLGIADTASDVPNNGDNAKVPFNWTQTASLGANGDTDYVSVTGTPDITIAVKNDKCVDIVIIKTDTDGEEIAGATFSLTKGPNLLTDIVVIKKGGSAEREEDRIAVDNGVFAIPAGGVTILGLGAGEYTLTEVSAPAGYIKTVQPVRFTAGRDGTVTYTNAADNPAPRVTPDNDNKQYTIQNEPGVELPEAGGPGTTILTLLGIMCMAFAGAGFLMKRQMLR